MKILGKIALILAFIALMAGCSGKKGDTINGKPSSGGKTLEVLLIVPDDIYRGELTDTINRYFARVCEGLNQPEPLFDVVQLNPAGFYKSEMFQKHRNIIIIDLKDTNKNKLYSSKDYKAAPQSYFEFSVSSRDSLYSLIRGTADTIIKSFYDNEYRRIGATFKKFENTKATTAIRNRFDLTLVLSEDFYVATEADNFMWIRKETQDVSLGLMIYKTAFDESLLAESKIIDLRNKITKENVPGPSHGNFMGIESRVPLIRKDVMLCGNVAAIETRGLWRMLYEPNVKITAFMGGAFVNYCFADKDKKNLIMIDGFVQSPKLSKRDQLMQLEAVIRNIKF